MFALRALTMEDSDAVAALVRAAFAGYDPPLLPAPSALRETAASVAATIAKGGGVAAVADGAIIGAMLWDDRDGGRYIGRLSVAGGWRRKGVAQALVAAAEVQARADGQPRLHAGVRLVLQGNRELFRALGFTEGRQHAHDGFAQPTWVEVEKHLA